MPDFAGFSEASSLTGKTIVIKYGGNALSFGVKNEHIFKEIAFLQKQGAQILLVHGGGPQISQTLSRMGIESKHSKGLRIADQDTIDVAEMVLCGKISHEIVSSLSRYDLKGLSLSGKDLQLFSVKPFANLEVDLGFFGEVDSVNSADLRILMRNFWIPVIAPIGFGPDGKTFMLDADHLAARIAATVKADKLFILTNVPGVFTNPDKPESMLSQVTYITALDLLNSGQVSGGMIPKLSSCIEAAQAGVKGVHIFSSDVAGAVIQNACTEKLVGTCISGD